RLRRPGARPAHLSLLSGHAPRPRADRRKPVDRQDCSRRRQLCRAPPRRARTGAGLRLARRRRAESRRRGAARLAARKPLLGRFARAAHPRERGERGRSRASVAAPAALRSAARRRAGSLPDVAWVNHARAPDRPWRLHCLDDPLAWALGPLDRRAPDLKYARGLDSLEAAPDNPGSSERFGRPPPTEIMTNAFFSDLLASIADRGRSVLKVKPWPKDAGNRTESLIEMCRALFA